MDTRSSIELKGINIYQDSKSQEWSIVLEKKEDSYIVVIVRSTLYDSDAEKNLKSLLNMVEDVLCTYCSSCKPEWRNDSR